MEILIIYLMVAVIAAIFLEYCYIGTKVKKGEVWWPFIIGGLLWPFYPIFLLIYAFTRRKYHDTTNYLFTRDNL